MRHGYLSVLLLLVAVYPAEAGRYDEPSFLTNHLVSGGVAKDGIPALTQSHLRSTRRNWLSSGRRRGHGDRHQRRTTGLSAQHRLVERDHQRPRRRSGGRSIPVPAYRYRPSLQRHPMATARKSSSVSPVC